MKEYGYSSSAVYIGGAKLNTVAAGSTPSSAIGPLIHMKIGAAQMLVLVMRTSTSVRILNPNVLHLNTGRT